MRIVAVQLVSLLALLLPTGEERRYSTKKLGDLVEFSRAHNASFLVYDDLGVLILVRSGQLTDVLKHFPEYKNPGYRVYPALSPDGKTVAFASGLTKLTGQGEAEEVWLFDSVTQTLNKIRERPPITPAFPVDLPFIMALSWSPDGKRLAVNAGREKLEVWSLDDHSTKILATDISQDTIASWSPDGTRIVYESQTRTGDTGVFHVNVIDLATGKVETIAEGRHPSWSIRGDQIAFLDVRKQWYFSVTPDGHSKKLMVKGPGWSSGGPLVNGPLVWSPDSRYALYNGYYDGGIEATLVDLEHGKKTVLTTGQPLAVVGWR